MSKIKKSTLSLLYVIIVASYLVTFNFIFSESLYHYVIAKPTLTWIPFFVKIILLGGAAFTCWVFLASLVYIISGSVNKWLFDKLPHNKFTTISTIALASLNCIINLSIIFDLFAGRGNLLAVESLVMDGFII